MILEYKNINIEYEIVKRKRKTICIKVDAEGKVSVITPLRISNEKVAEIVEKRAEWIIEKQAEMSKLCEKKISRKFQSGNTLMYLGREYPLHVIFDEKYTNIRVVFGGKTLKSPYDGLHFIIYTNTNDEEEMRKAMEKWYRARTLDIVKKKIQLYENNFKDKVTQIRVKEQKRRWASCTGKNAILFNWRCSMAREDVVEYIVVHEMCHFEHRDHSKNFWNRVESVMPDYKEKHEYLKKNGINMYI
ncbi:M48 family metallopeptidase [uncultured Clostridium sp.]|uniref:M48 family metallopeptidase n=1 Tax=uncultured Clostridium sp. TaxID=59620 RepID=UPI0025E2A4BB|nr:SprT family zinc-dependent metalloprotease [uncultured Clostridium sp.]